MKTLVRRAVIIITLFIQFAVLSYGQILAGTDDLGRTQLRTIQLPSSTVYAYTLWFKNNWKACKEPFISDTSARWLLNGHGHAMMSHWKVWQNSGRNKQWVSYKFFKKSLI